MSSAHCDIQTQMMLTEETLRFCNAHTGWSGNSEILRIYDVFDVYSVSYDASNWVNKMVREGTMMELDVWSLIVRIWIRREGNNTVRM